MKVRLNLATSPLVSNRRYAVSAVLVGTIAFVALVGLSWRAYNSWHADREHRAKVARLERETAEYREERRRLEAFFNQPENRQLRDRAAFLNGLIEQRSFPWTKIFMDLERSLPEGVRVVSIAPRMNEGHVEVRLVVGATSDEGKLKFLRALESSKEFSRIQLLSETRPTRSQEMDRVLLELVAWYATT
jgi:Tfp pilus assembly protein PilN